MAELRLASPKRYSRAVFLLGVLVLTLFGVPSGLTIALGVDFPGVTRLQELGGWAMIFYGISVIIAIPLALIEVLAVRLRGRS
jgi:hypothetical protein